MEDSLDTETMNNITPSLIPQTFAYVWKESGAPIFCQMEQDHSQIWELQFYWLDISKRLSYFEYVSSILLPLAQ